MGRKKTKFTTPPTTVVTASSSERKTSEKLRLGLLATTVGTFVAWPLVVSESAVLGDGLVLVMLLLLVGLFWAIDQARREEARIRFAPVDAAVLLLVGLYCSAGLVALPSGGARSILNLAWQWIGLTTGYFLLRQLVHRAIETRAIVAVMIGLAVATASHGLYQYCWKFPQMRAEYARDGDAMLRAEGMWYPPGSPERKQFDNRINSREPLATFALTNSLAGFLAPWLIVTLGLLLQPAVFTPVVNDRAKPYKDAEEPAKNKGSDRLKLAFMLLVIAACFVLTKSRTAWAAVALGTVGLGLWWKLRGRVISMKWVFAGVATVLVLIGGAIAVGGLDSEVVGEAGKSLKYRFEYWQATTKMIAESPWFGVGPGRFQDAYSQFKLPEASEEPADPHNFLFEIAATAGLFALAAMVAVLVLFTISVSGRARVLPSREFQDEKPAPINDAQLIASVKKFIYLGALAGYLASFPVGAMGTLLPDPFVYWGALPIGVVVLFGLDRWVRGGSLSSGLLGIAWGVLCVNLLAAGGISFPGVAASFWMLLALGVTGSELVLRQDNISWFSPVACDRCGGNRPTPVASDRAKLLCALVALIALSLLVACYFTAYGPVLAAQTEENAATLEPHQAEAHLLRAAEVDPWATEPWIQLANIAYSQWESEPTPERFDRFLQINQEILDRNPGKSPSWFAAAERSNEAYQQMRRPADQKWALAAYQKAVELYPNNAHYRAKWALALAAAGKKADARREAAKSLDFDRQNPHQDKRLPVELKERLENMTNRG